MHLRKLFRQLLSLPKTVYFNFKVLELKYAIKLPFYIDKDIRFGKLYKDIVKLNFEPKRFSIKFGEQVVDGIPENTKGYVSMSKDSCIEFDGYAEFAYGISFYTKENAYIKIGSDFYCNKNCVIAARKSIKIGNNVLMGWNISIIDSDGGNHLVYENDVLKENKKDIILGNHVWICLCSHIMKGVTIPNDTIVAYNSCVTKSFSDENSIIAGSPAIIVKRNIKWER